MPAPFFALPPPSHQLQISIVIPARDESEHLQGALDCFAMQRDAQGDLDPARFEILLLANNCRDATAQIARDWARRHPHIRLFVGEANFLAADACVGHARRVAMDAACARLGSLSQARLSQSRPGHVTRAIGSTDADTHVGPFWIAHTLAEMSAGARAVGGRIFLRPEGSPVSRRGYLLDTAYRLLAARLEAHLDPRAGDPWPRHFQFFGASLAICPQVYAQIGGLPRVRCLEDVALETLLQRHDIEVRHSPHVAVYTSARRDGRAEIGLSTQLDEWNASDLPWLVPSGQEIELRANLQRRLRSLWSARGAGENGADESEELSDLARYVLLTPQQLQSRVETAVYFGALWENFWNEVRASPLFRARLAPVPVECALLQLRCRLEGVLEKR